MTTDKPASVLPIRIVVLANKGFEADPLVHVLHSERGAPREDALGEITYGSYPRLRKKAQRTRAKLPAAAQPLVTLSYPNSEAPDALIEVWCIEDLLDPTANSSSSLAKAKALTPFFAKAPTDFVIAFGTGASPYPAFNGSVVIGSKVFIHNPFVPQSNAWAPPQADTVIGSAAIPTTFFRELDEDARYPAEGRFFQTPIGPTSLPRIIAGHAFVSVGVVNVVNYDDYAWADPSALASFQSVTAGRLKVGSLETTHGIVRACAGDLPFLYVTGVANPVERFDYETTPRVYGQNLIAAHNAGVALAWMLPQLVKTLLAARLADKSVVG